MAMRDWIEVVNATGIKAGRLDPGTVYTLSQKIIHDPVVAELKEKFAEGGIVPIGASAKVIREITETERELLRLRIKS